MPLRRAVLTACLGVLPLCAVAQESDWQTWEVEWDSALTLLVAPGWTQPDRSVADARPLLGEAGLGWRATRVLESGAEIGARVAVRLQSDHPARPAGLGVFPGPASPQGLFSGLSAGAAPLDQGPRTGLEIAYVYLNGGYGEITLGRDTGVAARFWAGPEEAFAFARADSALLDPSGVSILRTRNDATGPSAKLSYVSPRILGLRAGASFTPDSGEAQGLDRAARPGTRATFEAGLDLSRRLGREGPRLDASLGWTSTDLDPGLRAGPYADQSRTLSAGARLEFAHFSLGASWLSADNGWRTGGDHEGWSVGACADGFGWRWSAVYGQARDDAAGLEGEAISVGAARDLTDHIALSLGYRSDALETAGFADSDSGGIVFEITLSR